MTIDGETRLADSGGYLRIEEPQEDFRARIDAPGFNARIVRVDMSEGLHAFREAPMLPVGPPLELDATEGGEVTHDGVTLTIPAMSLVDEQGELAVGIVEANITYVSPLASALGPIPGPLASRCTARTRTSARISSIRRCRSYARRTRRPSRS